MNCASGDRIGVANDPSRLMREIGELSTTTTRCGGGPASLAGVTSFNRSSIVAETPSALPPCDDRRSARP